ncbi:MAG: tellurite resistance TerB family protein [Desulfobacteraceae bacterium]|jgi:hypothetical protein
MSVLNNISVNTNISSTKTQKNLTLQDSLIAIAVYAAQIDPDNPNDDIKRIEDLAKNNPLFREEPKALRARINKFINSMRVGNPLDTVGIAAMSLTPKYRKIAFKWAIELVLAEGKLSEEQNEILERLRIKLSIDSKAANKFITENSHSR